MYNNDQYDTEFPTLQQYQYQSPAITPTIRIGSWNLNGYTLNNYVLRDDIINYIDCDVYFVSETHLNEGEKNQY